MPANQTMFSLLPVKIKVDGGAGAKLGCFSDCNDSRGSWKSRYFYIIRDNSWGFCGSFVNEPAEGAFNRPLLLKGSPKVRALVKVCHFVTDCLEEKVMDVHFPFPLAAFNEVTLRRIGCSWAHKLPGHKDKLPSWNEGKEGGVVRMFRMKLLDGSFVLLCRVSTCLCGVNEANGELVLCRYGKEEDWSGLKSAAQAGHAFTWLNKDS